MLVESLIDADWLERLLAVTAAFVKQSRSPQPPTTCSTWRRPLLLNAYAAADALPYTCNPSGSAHDPRPCPLPPDWSAGYSSIFAAQAGEVAG